MFPTVYGLPSLQVQDIKDSVAKVRGQLNRAQQFQDQLRAFEVKFKPRTRSIHQKNMKGNGALGSAVPPFCPFEIHFRGLSLNSAKSDLR